MIHKTFILMMTLLVAAPATADSAPIVEVHRNKTGYYRVTRAYAKKLVQYSMKRFTPQCVTGTPHYVFNSRNLPIDPKTGQHYRGSANQETCKVLIGSARTPAALCVVSVHETAHLQGLDHVDDPWSLMYYAPKPLDPGCVRFAEKGMKKQ